MNLGGSPSKAPTSQAAREQAEDEGGELEKTREERREEGEEGARRPFFKEWQPLPAEKDLGDRATLGLDGEGCGSQAHSPGWGRM